ncbi:MAG: hypothetical protein KIT11_08415 [Fimbriimonadaceae bacterium]|nr:hypothetical protein [Fimbriimonadaceae bacterium]QYK56376.1 MAG: hypothetical protein KF733_02610 [Fimbriimonadaceae bacterium]
MKITCFETRRRLRDVDLELTRAEAEELVDYLRRMLDQPDVDRTYLSEIRDGRIEQEMSVSMV